MASSWVLSLAEGAAVTEGDDGDRLISGPFAPAVLRRLGPAAQDALDRLVHGDAEGRLAEAVLTGDGPEALARWYFALQQLARRSLLRAAVHADRDRLATLVPIAPSFVFHVNSPPPEQPYRLSRFVYLRRDGDDTVLESPLAFARVVLHDDRAAALVHALARPTAARDLGGRVLGLKAAAATSLLGLFAVAGMAVAVGDDGATAEEADPALPMWEFHDLLFHSRSRAGRHDAPVGGTYRHAGRLQPSPLKPAASAETVALYRPDPDKLKRDDPPFARVLEGRASIREYGKTPVTDRQIGEFLFRVGRVKERREWEAATPAGPIHVESTTRPYPAGGGLYELEMYLVVHVCEGLAAGLYHYDPAGHRLERLTGRTSEVDALLSDAAQSAGLAPDGLQVLVVLASRFPRLAWKYASLAYALTLKHVGVVYQTMYLAATAMGLAPCALGGGDSDLFARAAGVAYAEETSVGEFLLGSRGGVSPPLS